LPPQLAVYTREGCHLCDQMIAALRARLGDAAAAVEILDVDADEAARARYGLKVPVLLADGEPVCSGRLDEGLLDELLGA
jgi:hypothetical protein